MNNILVIGSNSFSGSTFIDFLLAKDIEVCGISRSNELNDVYLPYKWNRKNYHNYSFKRLDLNHDLEEIVNLISSNEYEAIVNFAAQSMVGQSWERPQDWLRTNTVSTIKFHNRIKDFKFLKKYLHISTPEVYGSNEKKVKENQAFCPSTPYAVSRAAADMSLKTFFDAYDFPVITTRAANVYGPGQQLYRIIPRAILFILLDKRMQLHGGGLSERSFINMRDVSEATWKILNSGEIGETYHISTQKSVSIYNLVQQICKKLNVNFDDHVDISEDRIGKDAYYLLDDAKIRNDLSWAEKVSLSSGLDECITWVEKNLDTLKALPFDYIHKK